LTPGESLQEHGERISGFDLVLVPDIAYFGDNILCLFDIGYQLLVPVRRQGPGLSHTVITGVALSELMPDFLGDERHERVKRNHQFGEDIERGFERFPVNGLFVTGLDHFQIPRAEVVPDEGIKAEQCFAESVLPEVAFYISQNGLVFVINPLYCQSVFFDSTLIFSCFSDIPSLYKAECIPEFVAEIPAVFTEFFIKKNIPSSLLRLTSDRSERHLRQILQSV
jgi:hypothetical protein